LSHVGQPSALEPCELLVRRGARAQPDEVNKRVDGHQRAGLEQPQRGERAVPQLPRPNAESD
jgi:hypothetical protein